MKRYARLAAILGFVAVLGTSLALAEPGDRLVTPVLPHVQEGEMYDRNTIFPFNEADFVSLPAPTEPVLNQSGQSSAPALPGPTAGGPRYAGPRASTAVPLGPRSGGAVYTPKQRADREISRLIRRLN